MRELVALTTAEALDEATVDAMVAKAQAYAAESAPKPDAKAALDLEQRLEDLAKEKGDA